MGSVEFAKFLIHEAQVAVSPGLGFGEYGDEFVRFALIENPMRINQAVRGIRKIMHVRVERICTMREINVGLLGCGTVGTGVARLLLERRDEIAVPFGAVLNLKRVADLDLDRDRGIRFPQACWSPTPAGSSRTRTSTSSSR